jgi:hypothetical protein
MDRMFTLMGAIFLEFQLFLKITSIFAGGIIAPFALTALQGYQFHRRLFARHTKPSFNMI